MAIDEKDISQRVRHVIDRALDEERLVGAVVLVAHDGEIVHRQAAGFADREAQQPMQENTIFRFASLSKPVVSAAGMALVERGTLTLDDRATDWLPEFRPRAPSGQEACITVRHLLTHTAGLTYGFSQVPDGLYQMAGISDGMDRSGIPMTEELRRLASVPLSNEPGTSWGYSLAIDVFGELLARAADTALPDVIELFITGPLGMSDTAFEVRDRKRLAVPYVDGNPPHRMLDPEVVHLKDGSHCRFSPSRILHSDSFVSGGTGMAGTTTDFLRFLETMRQGGGGILARETVQTMMSNQIGALRINVEPTPSWGFGIGGAVLVDSDLAEVPQANGTWKWGGVYGHHWFVDPKNRLSLVSLSNTAAEGMMGSFVTELRNAVYDVG